MDENQLAQLEERLIALEISKQAQMGQVVALQVALHALIRTHSAPKAARELFVVGLESLVGDQEGSDRLAPWVVAAKREAEELLASFEQAARAPG